MKRFVPLFAFLLALGSMTASACPGSSAKDGGKTDSSQTTKPAPK